MQKMGGEILQNFTAPNNGSIKILKTISDMIIFVPVLLRNIVEQGRDFIWERPLCCPGCGHYKVWSHGFVRRIFDGFSITPHRELPDLPVRLVRDEAQKRGILPAGASADLSTLYRFLNAQGLMKKTPYQAVDRRKFEAEFPNDLWQSDVMHGTGLQVGKERAGKVYLIAFIDDHSRLITHGKFYISESPVSFKVAFEQALLTRGLPRKLYVGNSAAYKSKQLQFTAAFLGIALIHAKSYSPRGKGKIERFFKTVRTELLPCFHGETLDEINAAFDLWLKEIYHKRHHSATSQSPFKRFTAKLECVCAAPEDLKDYFRTILRRTGAQATKTEL